MEKDKWEADKFSIVSDKGLVAIVHPPSKLGLADSTKAMEYNASLIVESVNACKEINPDNPMAAAEGIKELVNALEQIQRTTPTAITRGIAIKALAKLRE